MNVLLDTHSFLWFFQNPGRFSSKVRRILSSNENQLFVSAASAWEIAIKFRLGKLTLPEHPESLFPTLVLEGNFETLSVTPQHALRVASLPMLHKDPFDRLLIAQAQINELTILSVDPVIKKYDIAYLYAC